MSYTYQRRKWIGGLREPCIAEHGLVASKHRLIGEVGVDIMRKGGNAVDAAVAAAFVDCVVEPAMNGIGGEGIMTIHMANGENVIIDYVGRPSKNCTPDMYELLDEIEPGWMGWRRVKDDANVIGHKAVTVPGTVAGLAKALELYGTMELEEVLVPAIRIAEEGFVLHWWTVSHIVRTMETFYRFSEWRRLFLKEGKFPPRPYYYNPRVKPEKFVNKDLARSLRLIAREGPDAFYRGEIAEAIVAEMERGDGLITAEDLAMYEPMVMKPDLGSYRGYDILYDPSHAGTTLVEILNIIEGYDLKSYGFGSFEHIHLVAEAIALAYADRFKYMGDPGYVKVPQRGMVSKAYAEEQRKRISFDKALEVRPGDPWPYEECTTALAVIDEERNAVVINQTLVNAFGSGVIVPGTGIVLNNAMYGLNPEPGHANSIDGRKRRIQNVCPTILLQGDDPYLAVGAPGGRAIQTSIAQVIINVVDFGMDIQSAIDAPRITREVAEILLDSRFPEETYKRLMEIGHKVIYIDKELANWGRPIGIIYNRERNLLYGGVEHHFLGFISEAIGY